jgi:type I restriction-modification system DNA methylase subunit
LYIELLFGQGEDDYEYETNLMEDIVAPMGASESDKRVFAITLVNRLFFIKFLEDKGVFDEEDFLLKRVESYHEFEDDIAGNLYESQIKPLFYKLLNTPHSEREAKYRTGWFDDVDYLNGGLFRDNVPDEREYVVKDRILPTLIEDLIHHQPGDDEEGLDPSMVGSVFEKTITHLEYERDQQDIGAYYTPNDVTRMITRQTVDPKVKDELVEVYGEYSGVDSDAFADRVEDMPLQEVLRHIEDREGWFGDPRATEDALERVRNLRVLDPACGSGHFLTTAMDELHRVQLSLLRGLNAGELPEDERVFEEKKKLALNAIYGVDAEPVGCEIAKLRVWLKIVEDGWKDEYGRLPNIDVNISAGNSLIGLPIAGTTTASLDISDVYDTIDEVLERRMEYKYEEESGEKLEIERLEDEIRPALNRELIRQLNFEFETEIEDVSEFNGVMAAIDDDLLHSQVSSVKVERADEEALTDDQLERLSEAGFDYDEWRDVNKSARLNVKDREQSNEGDEEDWSTKGAIAEDLRGLLEDGFVFDEFIRRPLEYDFENIFGHPFHWFAEFPEASPRYGEDGDGGSRTLNFDLILGNPPYGDIMGQSEKVLTDTYETGAINDTAAQFVERQLQLLDEGGYFGNITTLRLVYQSDIHSVHNVMRESIETSRIACFASRPQSVFENAEVRAAIITGEKNNPEDGGEILTSEFIRFDGNSRDRVFSSEIPFASVEGLELGDRIGNPQDKYSIIPKVGPEEIEESLEALKEVSGTVFDDEMLDDETENVVWRKRHPRYWINPYLENVYPDGEKPQDFEPMYFDSKLKARAVFDVMQSSLFYLYWTAYGNERDLNWGQIEVFPMPDDEKMEEHEEQITELSDRLWTGMKRMYEEEGVIHAVEFKPIVDEIDELVGELYDLDDEEVEFLKGYHAEYGRGLDDGDSASLDEFLEDADIATTDD